ncbi:hypothetical protein BSKO_01124 [Bryopsis sp. KO-2023]|nr:hypothetical protein BSKO_01124 [Bryopsis sp. KO-2023]
MESRRNKSGKPKRRITPLKEVDRPLATFSSGAPASSQFHGIGQTSKEKFTVPSTAGKVKIGIEEDLSKGFEADWEELKKKHNYHEGRLRSSRDKTAKDVDGGTNLLAMLGKRAPTRFLNRIMKRHERMFTVRDREYYARSSSGESSSEDDDNASAHHSDSDEEAVEDGAENQGEDALQDERLDAGNYDLDDDFIDDSEVKDFFTGLLKRKPKFEGFCIVKGEVTVPLDEEDIAKRNAPKPSKKRKAPNKPLVRQDAKKPSHSQAKTVQRVEPKPVQQQQQQQQRQNSQEERVQNDPQPSAPQPLSLAEQAIQAALGSTQAPPVVQADHQPSSNAQSQGDPQPSNARKQQQAEPMEIDPEPSLKTAVQRGANELMLRAQWTNLPDKRMHQAVFLALCRAGPEGLSSKEISEESNGIWPGVVQSEKRRGCITKFISSLSGGEAPVFRREGYVYSLQCFPEVEQKAQLKKARKKTVPRPPSADTKKNQTQEAGTDKNLTTGSKPAAHQTDNSQNVNSSRMVDQAGVSSIPEAPPCQQNGPSTTKLPKRQGGNALDRNSNRCALQEKDSYVATERPGCSEDLVIGEVPKQQPVKAACRAQNLGGAV